MLNSSKGYESDDETTLTAFTGFIDFTGFTGLNPIHRPDGDLVPAYQPFTLNQLRPQAHPIQHPPTVVSTGCWGCDNLLTHARGLDPESHTCDRNVLNMYGFDDDDNDIDLL